MKPDVNRVLRIYLGADDNGGYEPLYCDERMRDAFPDCHQEMMELIAPYLSVDEQPDWTAGDLTQQWKRFEATLREKFPELDAIVVRALANRWHFSASR